MATRAYDIENHMVIGDMWQEDGEPLPEAPTVDQWIVNYGDGGELLAEATVDCGFADDDPQHPANTIVAHLLDGDDAAAGALMKLLLRNYARERINAGIRDGKWL